ncbi:MAG: hypothetical protein AAGH17_11625 [Pseudomonadota bacterium]
MTLAEIDPKGLIREAYKIEGITGGECRSIFLDWAINVPTDADPMAHILGLLDHYGTLHPDHPMTATLQAGLDAPAKTGRRGGRAARMGGA